jgi:hypothetical protein
LPVAAARNGLVMAEMALAVVLLVGAGLLIRSFSKLLAVDPGFRAERGRDVHDCRAGDEVRQVSGAPRAGESIVERMQRVSGHPERGDRHGLPLSNMMMRTSAHIEGTAAERPAERKVTDVAMATPGYFATMGIPMVSGRDFTDRDGSGAPVVSIINQEFAKRYFPNENPSASGSRSAGTRTRPRRAAT